MAASVARRSIAASSAGSPRQAFIGGRPRRTDERGTLPRIECSEPMEMDAVSRMDPFGARASLGPGLPDLYRLDALGVGPAARQLPVTVRILLENLVRHAGGGIVTADDVETLASWRPASPPRPRSRSCPPACSSRTSSWRSTREGMNGISASAGSPGRHDARVSTSSAVDDPAAGVAERGSRAGSGP